MEVLLTANHEVLLTGSPVNSSPRKVVVCRRKESCLGLLRLSTKVESNIGARLKSLGRFQTPRSVQGITADRRICGRTAIFKPTVSFGFRCLGDVSRIKSMFMEAKSYKSLFHFGGATSG